MIQPGSPGVAATQAVLGVERAMIALATATLLRSRACAAGSIFRGAAGEPLSPRLPHRGARWRSRTRGGHDFQ